MKLPFITAVAVVLLYSVVADTGPTNVLTPPRRFRDSPDARAEHSIGGHTVYPKNQNPIKPKKPWSRNSKVTRVSSNSKTVHGKFPVKTTLEDLLKNAGRYSKIKRPDVKGRRRSFAPKFDQARRSHHLRSAKFTDHPMTFEPVFSHSPLHSSINHKVGPLIGPLNFPGMGGRVYIRLLVPPSEETSSRVTLHLVNNGPVATFHVVHDHGDFANLEKPKPSFPHTKPNTLAQIPPRQVTVTEEKNRFIERHRKPNMLAQIPPQEVTVTEEKNRFVEKPEGHLDFTPSNMKAFEFYESQKHPEMHPNVNHIQNQLIHNQQQYLAAPNHNQLPLAFRPVENLMNLPVYPPLSIAGESQVEKERDNRGKVETPKETEAAVSDAQQSASFKHTWASPDLSQYSTAWSPSRAASLRQQEVMVNRREFPASEFIEEVRAPDFRFAYSFSRPVVETWGKSENSIAHPNPGENGFLVQPKHDATTSAAASDPEGEHRSTTSSSLTSTVASSPAPVKENKKKVT